MEVNLKSDLQYEDRAGYESENGYEYETNGTSSYEYYDTGGDYNEIFNERGQGLSNETGCMAGLDYDSYDESSIQTSHQMIAVFCDYEFIEIRKCCDKNHNLNLRYRIHLQIMESC